MERLSSGVTVAGDGAQKSSQRYQTPNQFRINQHNLSWAELLK